MWTFWARATASSTSAPHLGDPAGCSPGGEGNAGNIPAEAVQEAVQAGRDHLGGAGAAQTGGFSRAPR